MQLNPLTAISPVDGRYHITTNSLSSYFSEFALIKYRLNVEVEYFIMLSEKKIFPLSKKLKDSLRKIVINFNLQDAENIKAKERITNHDIKAVEYFLKEKIIAEGEEKISEFVHFGLTSQDVNNTAIPMLWRDAIEFEYLPQILNLRNSVFSLSQQWIAVPMLAHTHGQPASPTTVGKELLVFVDRLENQIQLFSYVPFTGKFGGATGNFNAHKVAFPSINWKKFANDFLEKKLHIERQQTTTQIEHYDNLAAHFDNIKRINTILTDLCRDVWTYISMDYFKQKQVKNEVGSSAMPHKVNPIDFENAEGNLGLANAMLEFFAAKLPVSRLQRDLTDSTVLRNIGVPMAHIAIAIKSIEKGLQKLILNEIKIKEDLNQNWAVIAEAIQTVLRRENFPKPYEALKNLTRGNSTINKESIHSFIDSLNIPAKLKKELKNITPFNYTGYAAE